MDQESGEGSPQANTERQFPEGTVGGGQRESRGPPWPGRPSLEPGAQAAALP